MYYTKIHTRFHSTEVEDLLQCVDKEFGLSANYAKGHGSIFETLMQTHHPNAYLFLIVRACGGTPQDLGVEGEPAVLMNIIFSSFTGSSLLELRVMDLAAKALHYAEIH